MKIFMTRSSVFFVALLFSFSHSLFAQTGGSTGKFASYEDFVADHVKSNLFVVQHDAGNKLTNIKRDQVDSEMLLQYSPDNVGDNTFKENLRILALVPDHPTVKNPPHGFLIFWDSTDGAGRYADCKDVAVTIGSQDLGDLPSEYQSKKNSDGSLNEFITVTLSGQQLADLAKADNVHVAVCTDQFDLTQEQRWTLRWIAANFMDTLDKKMAGDEASKNKLMMGNASAVKKTAIDNQTTDVKCEYVVEGYDGCDSADLTYRDDKGNTTQESGVSLPWSQVYYIPSDQLSSMFFYISAQNKNESGSIVTEIKENDNVVKGPTTSSGGYVISTSSGQLEP